jgi:hypothetical protein
MRVTEVEPPTSSSSDSSSSSRSASLWDERGDHALFTNDSRMRVTEVGPPTSSAQCISSYTQDRCQNRELDRVETVRRQMSLKTPKQQRGGDFLMQYQANRDHPEHSINELLPKGRQLQDTSHKLTATRLDSFMDRAGFELTDDTSRLNLAEEEPIQCSDRTAEMTASTLQLTSDGSLATLTGVKSSRVNSVPLGRTFVKEQKKIGAYERNLNGDGQMQRFTNKHGREMSLSIPDRSRQPVLGEMGQAANHRPEDPKCKHLHARKGDQLAYANTTDQLQNAKRVDIKGKNIQNMSTKNKVVPMSSRAFSQLSGISSKTLNQPLDVAMVGCTENAKRDERLSAKVLQQTRTSKLNIEDAIVDRERAGAQSNTVRTAVIARKDRIVLRKPSGKTSKLNIEDAIVDRERAGAQSNTVRTAVIARKDRIVQRKPSGKKITLDDSAVLPYRRGQAPIVSRTVLTRGHDDKAKNRHCLTFDTFSRNTRQERPAMSITAATGVKQGKNKIGQGLTFEETNQRGRGITATSLTAIPAHIVPTTGTQSQMKMKLDVQYRPVSTNRSG